MAVLNQLKHTIGLPKRIAVDNGPEFISKAVDAWVYRNQVALKFSRLGKPTDNAYVESFNGHFWTECLKQHCFEALAEAKEVNEAGGSSTTRNDHIGRYSNEHRGPYWPVGSRLRRQATDPSAD